jgi:hypothetical protein
MRSRRLLAGLAAFAVPMANINLASRDYRTLKNSGLPHFIQPDCQSVPDLSQFKVRWDFYRKPETVKGQFEAALKDGTLSKCEFVHPQYKLSSFFIGADEDFQTWIDSLQEPITYISDESQMVEVLHSRDPALASATVLVAYIAPEDTTKLEKFRHFVTQYFCDSSLATEAITRRGLVTARFAVVTDASLAQRMFIVPEKVLGEAKEDLIVFKYYQPTSVFYRYTADDFRDVDALNQYDAKLVQKQQAVDLHLKQLRLKLNRTKYILTDTEKELSHNSLRAPYVHEAVTSSMKSLAEASATEDFIVLPWLSEVDYYKSLDTFIYSQQLPALVVTVQAAADAAKVVRQLGLRAIAKENSGELLPIVGSEFVINKAYGKYYALGALTEVALLCYEPGKDETQRTVYYLPVTEATAAADIRDWLKRVKQGLESPLN